MKKSDFIEKRQNFSAKTIDELVAQLSAEDLETRFFAEMCLRDATGVWLDFQPASSPQVREKSIEKWRAWLKEREGKFKKKLKR